MPQPWQPAPFTCYLASEGRGERQRSERDWRESDRAALNAYVSTPYSSKYSNGGAQPLTYTTFDTAGYLSKSTDPRARQ